MIPELDNIRFNVLRNALYHSNRRRFFERVNRGLNFLVVMLGTAAVGSFSTLLELDPRFLGLAVAAVGAFQLVWDVGRQARDHQSLQRDYYFLLAEIEQSMSPGAEEIAKWQSQMIRITADEPPVLRAIDAKAYNDAIDALGKFDASERLIVPVWHRFAGLIFSFDGHEYKKKNEVEIPREG